MIDTYQVKTSNRFKETLEKLFESETPPYFEEYCQQFQSDPSSRIFVPLANMLRQMGKIDEAILVCEAGLSHHSDLVAGMVVLARCYFDKKDWQQAKEKLEHIILMTPDNLLAHRFLAEVSLNTHQISDAIHHFETALTLSPDDVELKQKLFALRKKYPDATPPPPIPPPPVIIYVPEKPEVEQKSPPAAVSVLSKQGFKERSVRPPLEDDWSITGPLSLSVGLPSSLPSSLPKYLPVAPLKEISQKDSFDFSMISISELVSQLKHSLTTPSISLDLDTERESAPLLHPAFLSVQMKELNKGKEDHFFSKTLADIYFEQGKYRQALFVYCAIKNTENHVSLDPEINLCQKKLYENYQKHPQKVDYLYSILSHF